MPEFPTEPSGVTSHMEVPNFFDVVIAGASFAGIEVFYQLRRSRAGRKLSVCVIDRQAAHGYIPLVHERLIDRVTAAQSFLPTAQLVMRDKHAHFVQAEVTGVDASQRSVSLSDGTIMRGHALVIALGSRLAPSERLPGAEHLTRYKFDAELADAHARLARLRSGAGPATVVVIGGGVSGVELAGELSYSLAARNNAQVILVQGATRLLPQLQPSAAEQSLTRLTRQGVQVRLNTRLLRVTPATLELQTADGPTEKLHYDLALWAAGIRPNPLLPQLGLSCTDHGYLSVNPQLQCRSAQAVYPDVFACGDAVRVADEQGEWPTLQRAIECLWQAKVVAKNVTRQLREGASTPLRSHKLRRDFPYGVSIGAHSLIVYGRLTLSLGIIAILFRRFLMWAYIRRYKWF